MELIVAVVVLAGAGGGAVVLTRHDLGPSPSAAHARASTPAEPSVVPGRIIYLDANDAGMTFLPLGPRPPDDRTLSVQHAYDALLQMPSKLNPIPATVSAYYGSLTDVDASPMAVNTRVWGFAVVRGCLVTPAPPPPGSPTTSPGPPMQCRQWEFVDARTGHDLGVMEQEVLPG